MYKILAKTRFLGKEVVYLTECHSTNEVAWEFVRSGRVTHGMVFCTENQTKGRGQRGNRWYSEPGRNLTFSLVFKHEELSVSSLFQLNQAVSLAIFQVLETITDGVLIKWPNDFVHKNDGKLGGILIENSISGQYVDCSVVGVGLNVNQTDFPFPGATSLRLVTDSEFDLGTLAGKLLSSIEEHYRLLIQKDFVRLQTSYLRNLYRFQQLAWYDDGVPFEGTIINVESDGQLVLQKQNGETRRYSLKTIKFL